MKSADSYNQLNKEQKQVVDAEKRPLLVVAGAGTGKTRVIVEKINKLLKSGIAPASILAVTFTEKAAAEMAERVTESSEGLLLDLPIMTFNGYGNSVLREFGTDIGIPRSFRLLSEQAQIVFIRERIDEFELDYFMPLTSSPDGIIEDIVKLFSKLKQHVIAPDAYKSYADGLPATDDAEATERKKHAELSRAYGTYIKLCRAENVVDYDDQIYLTIQLLEARPNVRKLLQDRYHTIFVDEFQDTNPMQSRLIDLIASDKHNLVVVGDDDQSIYGFRGATIANILSFKDRYPDASEVVLTTNYRSYQPILDAAYKLIQHNNPNRLEASLKINKRLTSKQPGQDPTLLRFADARSELEWLARDIADKYEKLKKDELISLAVLTRSNNGALAVHQALETLGVPHRVVGANPDLYSRPIVRMLLELVRTLVEPDNSASLHHTLISDLFSVDNQLVAPLASTARHEHQPLESALSEVPEVQDALQIIASLRADSAHSSVGQILWRAIDETGYKDRLLKRAPHDDETGVSVGHLKQFFDSLKEFENIATQPTAVQYMLALPALKAAGETTDDTLGLSENEVIVTTVHKAKGLEWDTVYLPRLSEQSFPMWRQGGGIALPEELRDGTESPADEHYNEERRVMYVAITRARQNLILSFSSGSRQPSRFIDEMLGARTADATPLTNGSASDIRLDVANETVQGVSVPTHIYDGQQVRLSASQAQALLNCPLNFYYKFVLRTPEEPKVSTTYGTQMHNFIQEINEGRQSGTLRPLKAMLSDLTLSWQKAGYSSKVQQERALAQAKDTLSEYYQLALNSPPPIAVEEKFEAVLPENITLYGRIDAVYDDGGIEIRDYKTGNKVRDDKSAKEKTSSSKQLTLYALAWQTIHGTLPARVSLHYVDTGFVGSVAKQQKSIDTIHSNLVQAAMNLRNGIFPAGGRHDYCLHPPLDEA